QILSRRPPKSEATRWRARPASDAAKLTATAMWPSREPERLRIMVALRNHAATVRPLPGLSDPRAVETLATQFIASLRREDYYRLVQRKSVPARRADPNDPSFDAERAVAYHLQRGDTD